MKSLAEEFCLKITKEKDFVDSIIEACKNDDVEEHIGKDELVVDTYYSIYKYIWKDRSSVVLLEYYKNKTKEGGYHWFLEKN